MGNCQACPSRKSVHNSNEEGVEDDEEKMIRVLRTTDNELFEFPGPVSVKDLLFGFQGFAVFHNKSHNSSVFKRKQQPLHPDTPLKFSQLYYLKPLGNPSLINPLLNYDHNNSLLAKQISNKLWVNQALIKPLIDIGSYPLINKSDEDLLLGKQVLMSSAKPSINGIARDLIAFNAQDQALNGFAGDLFAGKSQEKVVGNLNAQEEGALESSFAINAQERSLNEHAEAQNEKAIDGLPEGSLALNAHDIALNELAEGLLVINAQEKPSSFDVPIQSPSQQNILKVKKVRFSDEVMVIPSSNKLVDSAAAPTSSRMSNDIITSKEELIPQFGKAVGQFDKQVGYHSASKEELIPYMSKKEMNGVVRLKVVISKRQLTELMSSRASSDKQGNAIMEKMLAPLLSPTSSCHKSDSFLGVSSSPSWRPSLDHIPEDHPFHELL